jgi:hypothetical protein
VVQAVVLTAWVLGGGAERHDDGAGLASKGWVWTMGDGVRSSI